MSTPAPQPPRERGRKVASKSHGLQTMQIFYIVLGVVALVGVGALFVYSSGSNNESSAESVPVPAEDGTENDASNALPTPGASTDVLSPAERAESEGANPGTIAGGFYTLGDPDAPVTVIEYSDFQCPACGDFATNQLGSSLKQYAEAGEIYLIFHDFPLPYHQNAPAASHAARCAGEQGQAKFWQMHDMLFERQAQWSADATPEDQFMNFAGAIELDGDQFESCMESAKYAAEVQAAHQAAMAAQIPATPTFVVNGEQVNANSLIPAINAAIAQAEE